MGSEEWLSRYQEGVARLALDVPSSLGPALLRFQEELLRWNGKVNLTAIVQPDEVLEKHFLDSLAVLPEVDGARSLLDVGAGAGFPGLPLKLARPELQVTLVDAVAKKTAFIRQAAILLGVAQGTQVLHARLAGEPEREKVTPAERVVARALMDPGEWLSLARTYLAPGGRVLAMLGKAPEPESLQASAEPHGFRLETLRRYVLPFSGAERAIASFSAKS